MTTESNWQREPKSGNETAENEAGEKRKSRKLTFPAFSNVKAGNELKSNEMNFFDM